MSRENETETVGVVYRATAGHGKGAASPLVTGPIGPTLLRFALPVMGSSIAQSFTGTINTFWVSHMLGSSALAAIANAHILLGFLIGSVFGVAMAADMLVARATGNGDLRRAGMVAGTSLTLFATFAFVLMAVGLLGTPRFLVAMDVPAEIRASSESYLRIIFLALPFMYLFVLLSMMQRGAGDTSGPARFSMLALFLDAALNPLLIRGVGGLPSLGLAGAAWATLIANAVALLMLVLSLHRKRSPVLPRRATLHYLRPVGEIARQLVVMGFPLGLQMLVISSAAMVMMSFVNGYGAQTVAAFGATAQLWTYVQMPVLAISAAAASMVAQNVGAGQDHRVPSITRSAILASVSITVVLAAVCIALDRVILGLLLPDPAALAIARHINAVVVWAFVFFSVTYVLFGVMRAHGAVLVPLLILTFSTWIVRVGFTMLATPRLGADSIWWSYPIGLAVSNILAISYYRHGSWANAPARDAEAGPALGEAPDTGVSPPALDPLP